MSVQTNVPNYTIRTASTLAAHRCVDADGAYTGVDTTRDIVGVTQETAASGDDVTVRSRHAGTCKVTVATAVTKNDTLYKAASGKLGTASTGSVAVAIALEDASGDGSVIEVDFL